MIGKIIGVIVGVFSMGALGGAMTSLFNTIRQEGYKVFPNELLPPVNLINLRYRGIIGDGEYNEEMARQGINNSRAGKLFAGAEMLLNGYEAVSLFRRGHINEGKRDEMLAALGFTGERAEYLMQVTEQIPSARDVIAFAVREVYSPRIAEAFGQYEGVDDVLREAADDIKATGMTEAAFRKFWAAHWILPSMNQGYEMLHREIIKPDDLNNLMVAMDIMPWWREKLRAISFAPFTRVDVRRMHKLGSIDDDALIKAYKDVGYDDEKAKKLAEFTKAYNQEPEAAEKTDTDVGKTSEKEAARGAITKAYRNALIGKGEAEELLGLLDYSTEAIDLYITSEDFALAEEIQDDKIKIIRDAYVRRIYDFNKAVELLGLLNLPGAQVDNLMISWDTERDARASRPSKAELFKMRKKGIISVDILKTELAAHGFSDKYVDWYMQMQA